MWRHLSRDVSVAFYIYDVIGALALYMWCITKCALISATIFMYSTIHKNIKKVEKISKNWHFCHARHETVTHESWKTNQFITLKLQRFWHHRDLCSTLKSGVIVLTDRQTDTQTHTHTHRHTDTKIFIALSSSGTSITSRKNI
jgi:hypothetical protein